MEVRLLPPELVSHGWLDRPARVFADTASGQSLSRRPGLEALWMLESGDAAGTGRFTP